MFLPRTLYLDLDEMAKWILAIPTTGWSWSPKEVMWHNTGAPTLYQWDHQYSQTVRDCWGDNYDHYCTINQGWHSGPHFCGAPDKSIVLCEPRANGVHCRCANEIAFGVETVGDFRTGSDDPLTGRGLLSMQASANIIAALCMRMKWDPTAKYITFHRTCIQDHHACPGNLVTDAWAIGLVSTRFATLRGLPTPPPLPPARPVEAIDLTTVAGVQMAMNRLQIASPQLVVDGKLGKLTNAALRAFQTKWNTTATHNIDVDGLMGP